MKKTVLSFDFGASGARAFLCSLEHEKILLKEVHSFINEPISSDGTLYWNITKLFDEIKIGIKKALEYDNVESIGIDTWGVDFGLLSQDDILIEPPIHYRDKRTHGIIPKVTKIIDKTRLYEQTGIQIMKINTLFQLYSLLCDRPDYLNSAGTLLLMPDLFNFFLTNKKYAELTIASTTQLLCPYTKKWNKDLIHKLGLPLEIFPQLIQPGTIIGNLSNEICKELSIKPIPVISVASHDTASAVAAVPTKSKDFVFISCGTWSLLGTELDSPIINEQSMACNLTNEAGYGGTTTFLKNIIGLWLIQETKRQFKREKKEYTYNDMEQLARQCKPFLCFIDPDSPEFSEPGDIPAKIREYCRKTSQYVPQNDGEIIRCIYESLALKYRFAFEQIKSCTYKNYNEIYMVGGGTRDRLLCQLTADSIGSKVIAGPTEATALGNAAVQFIALGSIPDLPGARKIIASSCNTVTYSPIETKAWDEAYDRFLSIIN